MSAVKTSTGALLLAGSALVQAIGDHLTPWLGAGVLAAIALALVAQSGWPRLRRALLRELAGELELPATSTELEDAAPQVQIVLEDGPEFTTDVRFQARIVDPARRPLDPRRTRAYLRKLRGPDGPAPAPQTSLVPGPRADELVLDGRITFEPDRDGRQLGEWELVVESKRGSRTGRARRTLRIVHAIDPARPATELFERTSDWSTTAALELRGEGPADERFGEAVLRQRFAFQGGLGVRGRLRYRLHDPSTAGDVEISWGPELAARLRLGPGPGAGIGPAGGRAPLRELLIPTSDDDGEGELELSWNVERTPDGVYATLSIDGMTAVSSTVPEPFGTSPWRLGLRVRRLTAFAEGWRVLAA